MCFQADKSLLEVDDDLLLADFHRLHFEGQRLYERLHPLVDVVERFFDPESLRETGSVPVTLEGQPLDRLNELEYINGEVIAIDGVMGIMGNGIFSNMLAYREADWQRIREQIQSANAADKAKRS